MGLRLREAITLTVTLLSFLGLVTVVTLKLIQWYDAPANDYGIVFDCGSSHTSLNIFTWPHRSDQTLPLIFPATVNPGLVVESEQAISNFINNPSGAGASLGALLDTAMQAIPAASIPSTVVRLGATAGMRDAILQNATAAAEIMDSVRAFIATYPFRFQPEWAEVINGTMEGVFGWMSVNYLSGAITPVPKAKNSVALDMGGASTQITFVPNSPPKNESYSLCVYDECYNLYSHSYLGFGLNQFTLSLQNAAASGTLGNVSFPCLPTGAVANVPGSKTRWLVGAGDAAGCSALITPLLGKTACSECGLQGIYQPTIPSNQTIQAFSGFYFPFSAMHNSPLFNLSSDPSITEIAAAQTKLCAMSASQIASSFPDSFKYTSQYCLSVSYFVSLLTTGYNLPTNRTLSYLTSIDGQDIGWALGAIIMFENLLPVTPSMENGCSQGCSLLSGAGATAAIAVFAALTGVGIIALIVMRLRPKTDEHHPLLSNGHISL